MRLTTSRQVRGKVFRQLFLIALILAVGPVVILALLGVHFAGKSAEQIAATYSTQNLAYKRTVLDDLLGEIRRAAIEVSFSDEAWMLLRSTDMGTAEQLEQRALSRTINRVRTASELIHSIYFFDDRRISVVQSMVVFPAREFPDQSILDEAAAHPGSRIAAPRTVSSTRILSFVYPFSVFGAPYTGYVVVNIDSARFFERLFTAEERRSGSVIVADVHGTVYYSGFPAGEQYVRRSVRELGKAEGIFRADIIAGADYFVGAVRSDQSDLAIFQLQPTWVARGQLALLRRTLLLSLGTLVAASGALAFLASTWVYRPLRSLLLDLMSLRRQEPQTVESEFEFIGSEVHRILSRNAELGEQIDAFAPLLREHLAGDMLCSGTLDIAQLRSALGILGVRFSHRFFYAMFVDAEVEIPLFGFRNAIERRLRDDTVFAGALVSVVLSRRLHVLVNTDASDVTTMARIAAVHEDLMSARLSCTIAISPPFLQLDQLPEIVRSLEHRIDRKFFDGVGSVLIQDPDWEPEATMPESDQLPALVDAVKRADAAAVRSVLGDFRARIERDSRGSTDYARFSYFRLVVSVVDACARIGVVDNSKPGEITDEAFERTSMATTIDELDAFALGLALDLLHRIERMSDNRQYELVERAKDFMSHNLHRDLALDEIAYAVRLSAGHLNKLFREYAGTTVIEFLNAERVVRARRLLRESKLRVHEVASSVGYNSPRSFIRAFKRQTGITPAQYRSVAATSN
jgi:two-component system, response regulator YesN